VLRISKLNFASTPLAFTVCCSLAAGCAGSMASAPRGQAAGEWFVTLPSGGDLRRGLAYGSGGQSLPEARVSEPAPQLAQEAPGRVRKRIPHRRSQVAPPPAAAPVPSVEPQPLPAAPASAPAAPERSAQNELAQAETQAVEDYRAREASSQTQQAFRGGNAIYIGAGTLIVVLLVVLLVLLLV
jgi:hypothetical protein